MIHYPSIGTTIKNSTQVGISLASKYRTRVKLAGSDRSNRLKFNSNYRVRVNQQLVFPLSATDFPLSAVRPNVTLACYQQAGRVRKAESR